jgi:hypothetical protein
MPPYPNLISDSLLISETIQLLQSVGGRASAVKVVDYVMKIRQPEPDLAKLLVADLVESDPRLHLDEDTLELMSRILKAAHLPKRISSFSIWKRRERKLRRAA